MQSNEIFYIDYTFTNKSQIHNDLLVGIENIRTQIEEAELQGSVFVLEMFRGIYMNVAGYQPMVGSSYIKLPEYIKNKKAVINPKNDDQECFAWAMTIGQNLDKLPIHKKSCICLYVIPLSFNRS